MAPRLPRLSEKRRHADRRRCVLTSQPNRLFAKQRGDGRHFHLLPPPPEDTIDVSRPWTPGISRQWHHSRVDLPCRGDPVTLGVPLIPVARPVSSAPHGSLTDPCTLLGKIRVDRCAGLFSRSQTCCDGDEGGALHTVPSHQALSRGSIRTRYRSVLGSWVICTYTHMNSLTPLAHDDKIDEDLLRVTVEF